MNDHKILPKIQFLRLDWFIYLFFLNSLAFYQMSSIARGQRQIMHQLDNLSNLLRENMGERNRPVRTNSRKSTIAQPDQPLTVPLAITLAVGVLGLIIYKGIFTRN